MADDLTAPERIWICAWGGNWSPRAGGTQEHEYIRADLYEALLRERDELDFLFNEGGGESIAALESKAARTDAAEAALATARAALERIANTDPDDGTQWFHNVANEAIDVIDGGPHMSEPFNIIVESVVEHEDGSATMTFEYDDKTKTNLAEIGLEFVLHCAAYELGLQYVLDNLEKLK